MKLDDIKELAELFERYDEHTETDPGGGPVKAFAAAVSHLPDDKRREYLESARRAVMQIAAEHLAQDLNDLTLPGDPPVLALAVSASHDTGADFCRADGVIEYGFGQGSVTAASTNAYANELTKKGLDIVDVMDALLSAVSDGLLVKRKRPTQRATRNNPVRIVH